MLRFCSNWDFASKIPASRLASPRSGYTALSLIPLEFPSIAQYLLSDVDSNSVMKQLFCDCGVAIFS